MSGCVCLCVYCMCVSVFVRHRETERYSKRMREQERHGGVLSFQKAVYSEKYVMC